MTLWQLSRLWKSIKHVTIRKNGRTYNIIATRGILHRLYVSGAIDEWQEREENYHEEI